jgi:hypothetical protein
MFGCFIDGLGVVSDGEGHDEGRGGEGRELPYILGSDSGAVMGEFGSGVSADCRDWGPFNMSGEDLGKVLGSNVGMISLSCPRWNNGSETE